MRYLVWQATFAGNACNLMGLKGLEYDHQLIEGHAYDGTFPDGVLMSMSPHFKKDTKLVDDVMSNKRIKICSKRLVDFLKSKNLKNVEYLPLTIRDHKKQTASTEYSIVNPIKLQDAIDMKASEPVLNPIDQTVDELKQLVFDESKIDPEVRIFRFAGFTFPVLVDEKLAEELKAQKFVGMDFLDPSTVTR